MTLEEIRKQVLSEFTDVYPEFAESKDEVERHMHIFIRHMRKYKEEQLMYFTMLSNSADTEKSRQLGTNVAGKLREQIRGFHLAEAELSGRPV